MIIKKYIFSFRFSVKTSCSKYEQWISKLYFLPWETLVQPLMVMHTVGTYRIDTWTYTLFIRTTFRHSDIHKRFVSFCPCCLCHSLCVSIIFCKHIMNMQVWRRQLEHQNQPATPHNTQIHTLTHTHTKTNIQILHSHVLSAPLFERCMNVCRNKKLKNMDSY